jgi:poly-gamma-glutamate synthesis protein (capsule biosynthesis protein)
VDELRKETVVDVRRPLRVPAAVGFLALLTAGLPGVEAQSAARALSQAPRVLRLAFVGDIMGHDVNYGMEDYRDIYRGVRDVFLSEDLTFANLEFPLDPSRPPAGYPTFNGTPAYLAAAVDSGIDLFSLANNHAFDRGEEGIFQTIRALENARMRSARPFAYSGTRGNPHRPFHAETLIVRGVRVGFIAVAQFLNEPDQGRYVNVVDFSNEAQVDDFLTFVRGVSPLYDLFIVSYHGDHEYAQEPSPLKRAFFRQLLEAGAQIVVGHHPHVVQGYDLMQVRGTQRLAMYSMGNFISGMTWRLDPAEMQGIIAATGESYILAVDVRCDAAGCSVLQPDPIPIANYMNDRSQMVAARMSDLADGSVKVSPAWRAYYARRLGLMRAFLGRFAPATGSVRSGSAP